MDLQEKLISIYLSCKTYEQRLVTLDWLQRMRNINGNILTSDINWIALWYALNSIERQRAREGKNGL